MYQCLSKFDHLSILYKYYIILYYIILYYIILCKVKP